jgi:hypothetical protein
MPILLAGRAGGVLTPGRHLKYEQQPSVGKLFASLLAGFGLPDARFGDDGEGPLPDLIG